MKKRKGKEINIKINCGCPEHMVEFSYHKGLGRSMSICIYKIRYSDKAGRLMPYKKPRLMGDVMLIAPGLDKMFKYFKRVLKDE